MCMHMWIALLLAFTWSFLWNNSDNYFYTYCTIQRTSASSLYAKFFGFIHFVPFFMEFSQSPLSFALFFTPSRTRHSLYYSRSHTHTQQKLLWIQLFWMKKMKFYCIAYAKVWSEIKCMHGMGNATELAGYLRWIHEFQRTNICSVPLFMLIFGKYKSDGRQWCFCIQLAQIWWEI